VLNNNSSVSADKYRRELNEILEELIEYKPSLFSNIGMAKLFNWRAVFDFSSDAWDLYSNENRTAIINALAEKRTLFVALMTFKSMYVEMNRPDIACAAGLSLARFLEDIVVDPEYPVNYGQFDMTINENLF